MGASAWKIRGGLGVQALKNCLTSFAPVKVGFQGCHVAATLMSPTILIIIPGSNIVNDQDQLWSEYDKGCNCKSWNIIKEYVQ